MDYIESLLEKARQDPDNRIDELGRAIDRNGKRIYKRPQFIQEREIGEIAADTLRSIERENVEASNREYQHEER